MEKKITSEDGLTTDYIKNAVNTHSRIAVLEQIAESHDARISDMEDFHRQVVERFDQKIQLDATNQVIMERTLSKAVVSIDNLSENLKSTVDMANTAAKLAAKHETIGQTVIKFSGYLGILIGALWAAGTYFKIF